MTYYKENTNFNDLVTLAGQKNIPSKKPVVDKAKFQAILKDKIKKSKKK